MNPTNALLETDGTFVRNNEKFVHPELQGQNTRHDNTVSSIPGSNTSVHKVSGNTNVNELSSSTNANETILLFKGFVITNDGCLIPKKTPQLVHPHSTIYKRPHGAAPLGFEWNPIRAVWDPSYNVGDGSINPPQLMSPSGATTTKTSSNIITTKKRNKWKGFKVTENGSLFEFEIL